MVTGEDSTQAEVLRAYVVRGADSEGVGVLWEAGEFDLSRGEEGILWITEPPGHGV